ncbi:hypothetical protein ANCDUO_09604, partial [Ancylostoma duodenale]
MGQQELPPIVRNNGIGTGNTCLDYGEMAECAFEHSQFDIFARHKRKAKYFVNGCLIAFQVGVASVAYVFVVDHLQEELFTSKHNWKQLPWITSFDGVVASAGSLLYSFEGQAMVLPLENKLKHPEDMLGWTGVLTTGMSLVTIVYTYCGFFGYITYGENVQGSITLNLPDTG